MIENESCAACSFVKDCLRTDSGSFLSWKEELDSKTAGLFWSFWSPFEKKLLACKNRTDAMDCLIETLGFLNDNPSPQVLAAVRNAVRNMNHDLLDKDKGV